MKRLSDLRRKAAALIVAAELVIASTGAANAYWWSAGAANLNAYSTRVGAAVNFGSASAAVNYACSQAGSPCGYRYSNWTGGMYAVNTADGYGRGIWGVNF